MSESNIKGTLRDSYIDLSQITEIEVSGVDLFDYPDYSNAYIEKAQYKGRDMTEDEIDALQTNHPAWCYETILDEVWP